MTYKVQPIYQLHRLDIPIGDPTLRDRDSTPVSSPQRFECVNCSAVSESDALEVRCPRCRSAVLLADLETPSVTPTELERNPPGVWRFRKFLPVGADAGVVTLGEGGTPLLPARRLGEELGLVNLMIKDETMNPTGSFIDRGSTVLVSLAKQRGVTRFSCTTTGNLGASLAAYAAKAGIETRIRISPNIDRGKLYQMIMYGSKVELLSRSVGETSTSDHDGQQVSAANPYILEGEKTTGLEIVQDRGWTQPDVIVLPIGTGGNATMMWRSLLEMHRAGLTRAATSRLVGVRLRSSSPSLLAEGAHERIGGRRRDGAPSELEESEPLLRKAAETAVRASGGHAVEVSTREVLQGMSLLAKTEGIFTEPAGASVVASLRLAKEQGLITRRDSIVCVVTGAGLKDTRAIGRIARTPSQLIEPEDFMVRPQQIGETKLKIMRLLARGPAFGYTLWKTLSEERALSTASVYQHLLELERASLIRRSRIVRFGGRERIFYELTKKGSGLLDALVRENSR